MRKIFTLFGAFSTLFAAAQTTVLTENFSYATDTPLSGTGGWITYDGKEGQITITSGQAELRSNESEAVSRAFDTDAATGGNQPFLMNQVGSLNKITYSVDVTVTNEIGLAASAPGDFFMALTSDVTSTDVNLMYARIHLKKGAKGTYNLGILNTTGGGIAWIPVDYPIGEQVKIDVTYTVDTSNSNLQTATISVNGGPVVSTTVPGTGAAPSSIAGILLRQGASSGNLLIDNINVTTYDATVLAVSDLDGAKSKFIKNSLVDNTIEFTTKANVKIYSVSGQLVRSAAVNNGTSLDVSSLAKGVYVVTGDLEGKSVSQKIIKK